MAENSTFQAIVVMLQAYPKAQHETAASWESLIQTYEFAVEGIPADLVAECAKAFAQGRVDGYNHKFRPSPAEFAAKCREKLRSRTEHRRWIDRQQERFAALPTPDLPPQDDRAAHVHERLGYNPDRDRRVEIEPESLITPAMREEEQRERKRLEEFGAGDYATGCYRELKNCSLEEAQKWREEQKN